MVFIAQALTRYLVPVGIIVSVVLSGVALQRLSTEWRLVHLPLHATVEALGGLSAMAMALVLFLRRADASRPASYAALAFGFLCMGLVEIFHASAAPGHDFVWFRVLASFLGGLGFALVWWPEAWHIELKEKTLLLLIAAGAVAIGCASWHVKGSVPNLVQSGEFSLLAITLKNLASGLFAAGAARFLWDFEKSRKLEDYLLACLALLFAAAEYMFSYSALWDSHWWLWHFLRLLAYVLVLGYIGRGYLETVANLRVSLIETRNAETALRLSESQLRQSLDERERLARDLHDSIIQSIYAIGLRLSECRRLIVKDAQQAVQQIGVAVSEINAVIREVRLYISGIEVNITNGKELEAGMAALIHTLDGAQALRFYLQMDSAAAERLTPFQATHLLFIAKEAMSNSLRHSQARNGGVSLKLGEGVVRMIVEDDGVGFDSRVAADGHGLKNIRARADLLGAACECLSAADHGTRITIDVPFEVRHDHG